VHLNIKRYQKNLSPLLNLKILVNPHWLLNSISGQVIILELK
jgi:hypothetical protein